MGFGTSLLLSNGPQGTGTTWQVASAGFVNPSYLGGDFATTGLYASDGFQVEPAATLIVGFEGTYTGAAVVHEQTLDATGAGGWFTVQGYATDGSSSGSGVCATGVAYVFPVSGVRHRIRVTALSTGTLTARASMDSDATALFGAFVGGGPAGQIYTGSLQTVVSASPTVTAASAYASGNSVGGLLTLASAFLTRGTGLLQRVALNFKSSQTAQFDVVLFSANPTNTTITDKTAFSLNAADFDKVLGVIHCADATNLGTPSVIQAQSLATAIKATTGTSLFAAIVTRGTPTFTATTDLTAAFQIIQD